MSNKENSEPQFGPAMQALPNDRWRNFVIALYSEEAPRNGRLKYAVKQAGFGAKSYNTASAQAFRLINDKRIKKACAEYSHSLIRALAPDTIQAVREILANPKSKHHMKAVAAIMDRVDPIERAPLVTIHNDNSVTTIQTGEAMLDRIGVLCARLGIDPQVLLQARPEDRAKLIEGRAVTVADDAAPT